MKTVAPNRIGLNIEGGRAWFTPEPDITAYELALCMDVLFTVLVPQADHAFVSHNARAKFAALPDAAKRHFAIEPE